MRYESKSIKFSRQKVNFSKIYFSLFEKLNWHTIWQLVTWWIIFLANWNYLYNVVQIKCNKLIPKSLIYAKYLSRFPQFNVLYCEKIDNENNISIIFLHNINFYYNKLIFTIKIIIIIIIINYVYSESLLKILYKSVKSKLIKIELNDIFA